MGLFNLSRILSVLLTASLSWPAVAFAQTVKGILGQGTSLIVLVINLLMTLAVAIFIFGIVKFILAAGSPEKLKSAKFLIIYGLIGLFMLVCFWGIISIFKNTFSL